GVAERFEARMDGPKAGGHCRFLKICPPVVIYCAAALILQCDIPPGQICAIRMAAETFCSCLRQNRDGFGRPWAGRPLNTLKRLNAACPLKVEPCTKCEQILPGKALADRRGHQVLWMKRRKSRDHAAG